MNFKEQIQTKIHTTHPELDIIFTTPPDIEAGHFSIPCFTFSKILKRSPMAIATQLSPLVSELAFIDRTEAVSGFLNCFIRPEYLFRTVLLEIVSSGNTYGSGKTGAGKKVLIEHTSINPNASPHVGRARNAIIGDAIVQLLKFEGYEVDVHYFVNDIGKQIAMLLLGAQEKDQVSFHDLLDIYVSINNRLKETPQLEEQVFDLLHQLESGNVQVKKQFRSLVDICIEGQTSILAGLGIHYDTFDYESDYLFSQRLEQVLADLSKTGNLEEDDQGRLVLNLSDYDLPMRSPYMVLTRKDKTSLYPLRDIAFTIDKAAKDNDLNLIVLGEDQKLYHQQITAALDMLGYEAPKPIHYSFVLLSEGKMATRNGTVVLLEDFMKEAYEKAVTEIGKRHESVDTDTAKAIAYGSVRYAILKTSNDKNVTFDWDSALSFEGDTCPYLLYSMARINAILRKCSPVRDAAIDYSLLGEPEETALILELAKMPNIICQALTAFSPHVIANYLYSVTQLFTKYYHAHTIINPDNKPLTSARLQLITAVKQVVINCFRLLGIQSVERM